MEHRGFRLLPVSLLERYFKRYAIREYDCEPLTRLFKRLNDDLPNAFAKRITITWNLRRNRSLLIQNMWPDIRGKTRAIEMKLNVILNKGHCAQLLVI